MPYLDFVGQSRKDGARSHAAPSRLVNLYREPVAGTETGHLLKSVLGTVAFAELAQVFCRAMETISGTTYAVAGGYLLSVDAGGTVTQLAEVLDDEETTISGNNGHVCVTCGGRFFVWDGEALSEPTGGAFDGAGSAFFLGQRTFLTQPGGRQVEWTDPADPTTRDALAFATTETRDDLNIRGAVIDGRAWIFKEESTEIWALTGADDVVTPLDTLDVGLKAFGLLTTLPNGGFFVGSDGVAYATTGGTPSPVSTTAVETAIAQGVPSHCFYYEDEGHKFCVIRFRDRPAWVYDFATGEWHERAHGAKLEAWPIVATVKSGGRWYAATDLGSLTLLARVNADADAPLLRRAVSRTLHREQRWFTLSLLQLFGDQGAGLVETMSPVFLAVDGEGTLLDTTGGEVPLATGFRPSPTDVMCWIRVSKDRGNTWSREKWRSLGKLGEYARRTIWRRLGRFRQVNVELNMADPVDIPLSARVRVELS